MKNVNRRTFLGTAIGTGILGSTAMVGLPILPERVKELIDQGLQPTKNATDTETRNQSTAGYNIVPSYFHWSFGEKYRSNPIEAGSLDFKVWFSPIAERKDYNFRDEVFKKCQEIDQKRNNKPVALCYSGGESSEIIALAMHQLGIPFELYYLDNWLLNQANRKSFAEPFAKKLGAPLNVVSISERFFDQEILRSDFAESGLDHPTPMLMKYLFSVIPASHFIVTGSGNLERSGKRNEIIGAEQAPLPNLRDLSWTFSPSQVSYYDWATKNSRPGEYYFFQSSPGLLLSVMESKLINKSFPNVNIKGLVYSSFPEITPRSKSTNWDSPLAAAQLFEFRERLVGEAKRRQMGYWRLSAGCTANIAGLYRS